MTTMATNMIECTNSEVSANKKVAQSEVQFSVLSLKFNDKRNAINAEYGMKSTKQKTLETVKMHLRTRQWQMLRAVD